MEEMGGVKVRSERGHKGRGRNVRRGRDNERRKVDGREGTHIHVVHNFRSSHTRCA